MNERSYLQAAGWQWLLPLYDQWAKLLGADRVRNKILGQAVFAPDHRVLDIGCGTGSLAVLIKQLYSRVAVFGLDADTQALAFGQRKAARRGLNIQFDSGVSDQLPYGDASFDHVFCTFMFSLLPRVQKTATFHEIRRVLKSSGSFHLLDLAKMPRGGFLLTSLHPGHRFEVCTEDQILALLDGAGFHHARKTGQDTIWVWPVASYQASA